MPNVSRGNERQTCFQEDVSRSSQGNDSRSVTPKDVSSESATAQDVAERKLNSRDLEERAQALLDEAIEESFPASDPISIPTFEEAMEIVKAQESCDITQRRNESPRP